MADLRVLDDPPMNARMTRLRGDRVERERKAKKEEPFQEAARGLVTPPSSEFKSGGQRRQPSKEVQDALDRIIRPSPHPGRKRGKATTPFDRYSLNAAKVANKKRHKAKKKRAR
jgi:hypothetical protein